MNTEQEIEEFYLRQEEANQAWAQNSKKWRKEARRRKKKIAKALTLRRKAERRAKHG